MITSQTDSHHCTFQVITVHHCTLKQALVTVSCSDISTTDRG